MENKEPSGEGAAKQEAAGEEYKQEAEQLLKLHRQDKVLTPSEMFAAVGTYLLFVGAVTGVGMLASYSHHETTANVFLLISIALLLIGIIGALWYLLVSFRKKPTEEVGPGKQRILERIAQSPTFRFLIRLISNPIFRILEFVYLVFWIAFIIIRIFPQNPRISLALIVFGMILLVQFLVGESLRWHEKQVKDLWEFNVQVQGVMYALMGSIKIGFEGHKQNTEAIKSTLDIIGDMNRSLLQVTASADEPKHLDEPTTEEDKGS